MPNDTLPDNPSKQQIIETAARHVCPHRVETFKLMGTVPVMGRREGNYFWDMDGRKLFDVHINGGTYNLGHRNPEIIATLRSALDDYDIGNHHFASEPRARLAKTLCRLVPGAMQYCVLTTSGAEAVDVTIRTAAKSHRATENRLLYRIVSWSRRAESTGRIRGASGILSLRHSRRRIHPSPL